MKKIYIFLLLPLSVFLLLNITQFQAEAKDSDFEIADGVLIKYNGSDKTVQISKGVTTIGDYAFRNSEVLKVILPNGITEIGEGAFESSSLTEITLPDSVTTIGDYAFAGCFNLEKFTIPSSVSSMGAGVLNEDSLLTDIQVSTENSYFSSDGIMLYSNDKTVLISYPSADGEITLPEGIIEIAGKVFEDSLNTDCQVTKVIFPGTLKRLGDDAFYQCSVLEEITLPSSLESFGKQSFESCYKLNKLNLFDTNDEINFVYEDGVLYNKDKTVIYLFIERNDIVIPDTITGIGSYAFPFVTGTVVVPSSVTAFGENIFVKDKEDDTWSGNRIIVYGYLNSSIEKYCKENPYAIKFLAFDDTYTIHYNLYDEVNSPKNPTSYTRNTATIKLANPTRAGYVFNNWFTFYAPDIYGNYTKTYTDEYGSSKITQITKGSVGDIILEAGWEKVTTGQAKITSAKKKASTKITLNLKSVSGAKGYQIIYANNSAFTSGKKTVYTQALKYGLTKLKKGKTYYIKVRAYEIDSCGKKVYGKYSKVSKVKL